MGKYKNKITAGLVIVIVLAFVFWYGGNAPGLRGWKPQQKQVENAVVVTGNTKTETEEKTENVLKKEEPEKEPEKNNNQPETEITKTEEVIPAAEEKEIQPEAEVEETTVIEETENTPAFTSSPEPVDVESAVITERELTCTLSVRCDTILKNIDWLDKEKVDFVPQNGVVYEEKTVTFYEGESVFNLLLREMKRNKIHMEFENTPIYKSAYIEGIANLYEFDCGELSGWMYKVNGWFPNYGSSRYLLKEGDRVEWVYTCDLGADVGGSYSARNGKLI